MINIDKNIALPTPKGGAGMDSKYPFKDMNVGDSFFMDKGQAVASSNAGYHRRRYGGEFTTRAEGTGTRVWRTA